MLGVLNIDKSDTTKQLIIHAACKRYDSVR